MPTTPACPGHGQERHLLEQTFDYERGNLLRGRGATLRYSVLRTAVGTRRTARTAGDRPASTQDRGERVGGSRHAANACDLRP